MADMREAKKNWGEMPQILEQGIETLPQLLIYQAGRFGDRVLHRKKDFGIWQRYTWNDVVEQVKTFAMGLVSLGVKRGQTIAIVGENEPELFWSEYAAQSIGAKAVCFYPDLTATQMEYMIVHSEAVIIVCEDQEQVDKVLELEGKIPGVHTIVYWDERGMWKYDHPKLMTFQKVQQKGREHIARHPQSFKEEVAVGKGDDIAALCYTSGTTGLPKGCILSHTYLFDTVLRLAGGCSLKPFTQYLSYISPAWGTEQMFGIAMGLLLPLVVNFPEEPETVQENIREVGVEALVFSPPQWESLASLVQSKIMDAGPIRQWVYKWGIGVGRKVNLGRLEGKKVSLAWRFIYFLADKVVLWHLRDNLGLQNSYFNLSGGAGMSPDVFRFFHAMGVKLRSVFGTTEMNLLTLNQGEAYDLETIGTVLPVLPQLGPPLEFKLTDKGELLARGGLGFLGYYRNPEATAKQMMDGWYCTGDVVSMTEKSELVYLDRLVDMRELSTGHLYPPQFIETRLRFSPFIKNAMTLGDKRKSFVGAFINIDATTLGTWAEKRGVAYSTFADLSQNQRIREVIKGEIEKVNRLLPEGSKVQRFINLPKELDADEDELTRSRKIRRKFLEEKYEYFISCMYQDLSEFKAEVPVKYQDGRTGVLNATVHINNLGDGGGKIQ